MAEQKLTPTDVFEYQDSSRGDAAWAHVKRAVDNWDNVKRLFQNTRSMADWDESQHQRDDHGRFGAGGPGNHDLVKYSVGDNVSGAHVERVRAAVERLPTPAVQAANKPIVVPVSGRIKGASVNTVGQYNHEMNRIRVSDRAGRNTANVVAHEMTHAIVANNRDEFLSTGGAFDTDVKQALPENMLLLAHYFKNAGEAVAQAGAMLLGERLSYAGEFRQTFSNTVEATRQAFQRLGILPKEK